MHRKTYKLYESELHTGLQLLSCDGEGDLKTLLLGKSELSLNNNTRNSRRVT